MAAINVLILHHTFSFFSLGDTSKEPVQTTSQTLSMDLTNSQVDQHLWICGNIFSLPMQYIFKSGCLLECFCKPCNSSFSVHTIHSAAAYHRKYDFLYHLTHTHHISYNIRSLQLCIWCTALLLQQPPFFVSSL